MEEISIQLIRNATLKIKYATKTLLVDPMLGDKESFRSFVVPEEKLNPTISLPYSIDSILEGVDAILLTHSHPDHFDQKAIETIPKEVQFFIQPADEKIVADEKFTNASVIQSSRQYGPIHITRTSGQHGPDHLLDLLGEVSGFVLQAEGYPTLYIIGDCIWTEEINNQLEKYRPDLVITNSGGARFRGGKDSILMDVSETVRVSQQVPEALVIAVHLESLDHCTVTREMINEEARKHSCNLIAPANGEIVHF